MTDTGVDLVTGALSYTGRHIVTELLERQRSVRTLTAHPTATLRSRRGSTFGRTASTIRSRWRAPSKA